MAEPGAGAEFSAGGVIADSGYYAGAVEALRSACARIGAAADAAQRAGFFAGIADWNDEADASAHDADRDAVMAMAEALRAKESVAAYADAARQTLAGVTTAFAAAADPANSPAAAQNDSDEAEDESEEESAFSGHLAGALVALAEERDRDEDSGTDEEGYIKMAKTLSVLANAHTDYGDVDENLIMLANARTAYQKATEGGLTESVGRRCEGFIGRRPQIHLHDRVPLRADCTVGGSHRVQRRGVRPPVGCAGRGAHQPGSGHCHRF